MDWSTMTDEELAEALIEVRRDSIEREEIIDELKRRNPDGWMDIVQRANEEKDLAEEAERQVAAAAETGDPNAVLAAADTNRDGKIDDKEKAAAAKATGSAESDIERLIEGAEAAAVPGWITEAMGGIPPTPAQTAAILSAVEDWTGNKVASLADIPASPGARAAVMEVASGEGIQQTGGEMIALPSVLPGKNYEVSYDQLDAAISFGLKPREIAQLMFRAESLGLTDSQGKPAWQVLVALDRAQRGKQGGPKRKPAGSGDPSSIADAAKADEALQEKGRGKTLSVQASKYKEGLDLYGTPTLAFLHSVDANLAARLIGNARAGEEPDPEDINKASQAMIDAGWDKTALQDMGLAVENLNSVLTAEAARAAEAKGADKPVVTANLPDRNSIKQQMTDLFQSWFFRDPTPQELENFSARVEGAVIGEARSQGSQLASVMEAQAGDTGDDYDEDPYQLTTNKGYDPQADLIAQARQSSEYQELYGNRPSGMSEEQYAAQFQQGYSSTLGGLSADPQAVRAGLRTGDVNTTIGYASMSDKAQANSPYLGRLARAAQVVANFT